MKHFVDNDHFGTAPADPPRAVSRPGMILPFTLVIMLLMALMGAAILTSTNTELMISRNTQTGRNAFTTADTAAAVGTLMGRILLYPELGSPEQIFGTGEGTQPSIPYTVEINNVSKFDLGALKEEGADDYRQRYIRAGSSDGRTGDSGEDLSPHLTLKAKGGATEVVVATVYITMDVMDAKLSGGSLGDNDHYGERGTGKTQVILAVTANGRPFDREDRAEEVSAFDGGGLDESRSIVTTIYKEVM